MICTFLATILAAPPAVELVLSIKDPIFTAEKGPVFSATLKNNGPKPIQILDIQDGSAHHWSNPHIGMAWMPVNREPMPTATPKCTIGRCGNVNPILPEMFHEIAPGKSTPLSLGWLFYEPPQPGRYRVAFYYEVVAGGTPKGVGASDEAKILQKYSALTPMKLRSNVIFVTVK